MQKKKILLLSRYDRMGASSRMRSYQYVPILENHGFKIDISPFFDHSYLENLYANRRRNKINITHRYIQRLYKVINCFKYDLIWIEKELFPWLPSWAEEMLSACGIKYIVDYDDAVFHRYDKLENNLLKKMIGLKIDRIMRGATLVIAGNDYLAGRALTAGAHRVEIIPTIIDLKKYSIGDPVRNEHFTVGWIGSPTTAPYLYNVREAMMKVSEKCNLRLVTIGSGPLTMKNIDIENLPWSEKTEVEHIKNFDVGIMPLPNEPWTRGKCGYKLIQYMACGKPVVGSDVGVNIKIIDHEENGFLACSINDWVNALTRLSTDESLRKQMGRIGRNKIKTEYCLQITAPKFIRLIEDCI